MSRPQISFSLRKSLAVQLGETAGKEVADLLQELCDRIDQLERNKVDVTPIVKLAHEDAAGPVRRAA